MELFVVIHVFVCARRRTTAIIMGARSKAFRVENSTPNLNTFKHTQISWKNTHISWCCWFTSTLLGKSLNSFQLAAELKDVKRTFSSTSEERERERAAENAYCVTRLNKLCFPVFSLLNERKISQMQIALYVTSFFLSQSEVQRRSVRKWELLPIYISRLSQQLTPNDPQSQTINCKWNSSEI